MIRTKSKAKALKHALFLVGLTIFVITMTGCQEQTQFNDQPVSVDSQSLRPEGIPDVLDGENNQCLGMDEVRCSEAADCQAMDDKNMNFMACIPLEDPIVVEEPTVEDPVVTPPSNNDGNNNNYDNGGSGNDLSDYNGLPDNEEEEPVYNGSGSNQGNEKDQLLGCGRNKVVVCHVPHGNAGNAHSICININGYENGHKRHEGDHLGACDSEDLAGVN